MKVEVKLCQAQTQYEERVSLYRRRTKAFNANISVVPECEWLKGSTVYGKNVNCFPCYTYIN